MLELIFFKTDFLNFVCNTTFFIVESCFFENWKNILPSQIIILKFLQHLHTFSTAPTFPTKGTHFLQQPKTKGLSFDPLSFLVNESVTKNSGQTNQQTEKALMWSIIPTYKKSMKFRQ